LDGRQIEAMKEPEGTCFDADIQVQPDQFLLIVIWMNNNAAAAFMKNS
jgi:hypothetical protein